MKLILRGWTLRNVDRRMTGNLNGLFRQVITERGGGAVIVGNQEHLAPELRFHLFAKVVHRLRRARPAAEACAGIALKGQGDARRAEDVCVDADDGDERTETDCDARKGPCASAFGEQGGEMGHRKNCERHRSWSRPVDFRIVVQRDPDVERDKRRGESEQEARLPVHIRLILQHPDAERGCDCGKPEREFVVTVVFERVPKKVEAHECESRDDPKDGAISEA